MTQLLIFLISAPASGAPAEECSFTDAVSVEQRSCAEGPSEDSWSVLQVDDLGEITVDKEALGNTLGAWELPPEEVAVSEDPDYDGDSGDFDEWFEAAWFLIRLLIAAGESYEGSDAYWSDVGLTGQYDGTLSVPNSSTPAWLTMQHSGGVIRGSIVTLSDSLEIDGGICGNFQVPVMSLPVRGAAPAPFDASGSTTRNLTLANVMWGTTDVDFDLMLDPVDHKTLTVEIHIDAPWPCADSKIDGSFTRRNDRL